MVFMHVKEKQNPRTEVKKNNNLFGDGGNASSNVLEFKISVIPSPFISRRFLFACLLFPPSEHLRQRNSDLKIKYIYYFQPRL